MILELENGDLYYEVYGKGDAIIFINGFAAGISTWYPVIKNLKKRYQCILYDYIGTGKSNNHKDYTFSLNSYSADLNALIEKIGAKDVHLVGYSMGGWIAQYFVSQSSLGQWGTKVKSLSLINTSSKIFQRQNWIISHFIDVLHDSDIDVFSRLMFLSYYSPEYFEKNIENLERIKNLANLTFAQQAKENWVEILKSCLPFDEEAQLINLNIPVLLISGEDDFLCPRMTAARLNELIPNITWQEFKSIGHAIPMENHIELKARLSSFFEKGENLK